MNDYGGPYRAVFEQIADEMQGELPLTGQGYQCLLPLLIPCVNRTASVGTNHDKFVFSTLKPTHATLDMMNYFGKLMGLAIRHHLSLGLDLSTLVWRPLVQLPVSLAHLETVDVLAVKSLESIAALGISLEEKLLEQQLQLQSQSSQPIDTTFTTAGNTASMTINIDDNIRLDSSYVPDEWQDLTFTVALPDGGPRVPLIPNGEVIPVNLGK